MSSDIAIIDFEAISYQPIYIDLCNLFVTIPESIRTSMPAFIKIYHDKLTEIGLIDTTIYTLDRLTNDINKNVATAGLI